MSEHPPVPWNAPAVERGIGFFETVLLVGRRAVLWEPHLDRLYRSLARLELPAPDRGALLAEARERVKDLDEGERGLRLAWLAVGADLDDPASWRLDMTLREKPPHAHARRNGSRAVTLPPELRRDTPGVKSTSYFAAVLGLRLAKRRGADEGLFAEADGAYAEGTSTGLVVWNGGDLLRPAPPSLPSVTQAAFLASGSTAARLTREQLLSGALVVGSLTKAVPLLELDGAPCQVPPAMREAAAAFNERLASDPALASEL